MSEPVRKPQEITQLLHAWGGGDEAALDKLIPAVYGELRRIAGNFMRRQNRANTLQASALVNEAFMRLVDSNKVNWQSRTHFFAVSAQLMRRVLVDAARRRNNAVEIDCVSRWMSVSIFPPSQRSILSHSTKLC
jgi:RNA polymerase sigma factor (TIGR02999 family)